MRIYKFGDFVLNTFERSVVKNGKHINLTTKTFDVLQLLVERSGAIVTKDEMLGSVWDGRFVEESNLPVQVARLRRALDQTKTRRFIETVYGIGYRFVTPTQLLNQSERGDGRLVRNYDMHTELNKAAGILLQAARNIRLLVPEER